MKDSSHRPSGQSIKLERHKPMPDAVISAAALRAEILAQLNRAKTF
jgi:hypothetical protein